MRVVSPIRGCQCPGGASGTSLVAGDATIAVTGVGSAQAPFSIKFGVFEILSKLVATAGKFVDLTLTGAGTDVSPANFTVALHTGINDSSTPLTGTTVTPSADARTYTISPAGTIAALTVTLPATPTMLEYEMIIIATQTITTLTVAAAGSNTVANMPTTLAAGGVFRARLIGTVWRRVG